MPRRLSLNGLKVLVAEDNLTVQTTLSILLEDFGCKVDFASNGKEALTKVSIGHYDIILMDVHMPVMSGLEATQLIRSQNSKHLPIVALTAEGDKKLCLSAGMDDYLEKPFEEKTLKQKILNNA